MAEAGPRVSAVVTAYNCAQYLPQALDSVFNQSAAPAEVILVDDHSSDDIDAVLERYGGRLQYVRHAHNAGAGAARNTGARLASGDCLAFLDGDDYWRLDKLALQLQALRGDPALEAVFGHVQQFVSPDAGGPVAAPEAPMPGRFASTMLARTAAFWRVGPFPEGMLRGEVLDWLLRAGEAGLRHTVLPEVCLYRRIHDTNLSRRHKDEHGDYLRAIKDSLDRRRAGGNRR